MTLELFKVEKDVCEGDILYHKFVTRARRRLDRRSSVWRLSVFESSKASDAGGE